MATAGDRCEACGDMVAVHDPPVAVRITVGTLPGTVDLDADELEVDGLDSYLLAAFDTTPGIGGVNVLYGASCFSEKFDVSTAEIKRLRGRSARRREK